MSLSKRDFLKISSCVALGAIIRTFVLSNFRDVLRKRVEIITPTSDWKRAFEAIYLWSSGLDPYAGNVFHEYPISLQAYKLISNYLSVDLVFVATDVTTAILLKKSTHRQLLLSDATEPDANSRSNLVYLVYLFSPFSIAACAGQSTSIFTNFLMAVICYILPMEPFRALTCVLSALLACNNLHYVNLILPIFLCLEYCSHKRQTQRNHDNNPRKNLYYEEFNFRRSFLTSLGIFSASVLTLILTSFYLMGNSWSFVGATYSFVLHFQDLTPNIGLFWYFFTEMFDHFLDFFTWVTQINAFIHAIPLAVYLRNEPFFALYTILLTSTIFQPYPNLAHVGLCTSLLFQYSNMFVYMKRGLIVACALVTCTCLWPIFWHLWIRLGTANSNFYFGATLAFMAALILLLLDLFNARIALKVNAKLKLQSQATEKQSTETGKVD